VPKPPPDLDSCTDEALLSAVVGPRAARAMLAAAGDLGSLVAAGPPAVASATGVGVASAWRVQAALALARRVEVQRALPREPVDGPAAVARLLAGRVAGLDHERLLLVVVDRRLRPLATRELTRGGGAATIVDPPQVLRAVLAAGGDAFLLAHNHPSGQPEASTQDVAVTRRLAEAAEAAGLRFLDHVVLAGGQARSVFAALGYPSIPRRLSL
jgi:DNA repair protein RadC